MASATRWNYLNDRRRNSLLFGRAYGDDEEVSFQLYEQDRSLRARYLRELLEIQPHETVLEIGSGIGITARHLAPHVAHVHCCDISEMFLGEARAYCEGVENMSFHHMDKVPAELTFFADQSIDVAYSEAVFIHLNIYDIFWYFRELGRVVRPDGRLWFNALSYENIHMNQLEAQANIYKKRLMARPELLPELLCWHTREMIETLARREGFELAEFEDQRYLMRKVESHAYARSE